LGSKVRGGDVKDAAVTSQPLPAEPHEDGAARRPMWELAECTCPEYCERDHERD
jgi:hypothetical protein